MAKTENKGLSPEAVARLRVVLEAQAAEDRKLMGAFRHTAGAYVHQGRWAAFTDALAWMDAELETDSRA